MQPITTLVCCSFVLSCAAALAEEQHGPELKPQFADDFQTDSRGDYEIQGAVAWQAGKITLAPGASLARTLNGGSEAQVELTLFHAEPTEDGQTSSARLRFSLDGAADCFVVWSLSRADGQVTGSLRVVDTVPRQDGTVQEATRREWPLESSEVSGRWQVRYHFGLLMARRLADPPDPARIETRERVLAGLDKSSAGVRTIALAAAGAPLELEALSAQAAPGQQSSPDQQRQLAEAARLNNQAGQLYRSGRPQQATPLAQQVVEILREVLGEQHPDYATSLHNLARQYASMDEYAKAEPQFVEAQRIRQRVLGEEHPSYAESLGNLALLYHSTGDFAKAEPLWLKARDIHKKALGEVHPAYVGTLNNLAELYRSMGEYAKAEPLALQTLEILKKVVGEEHPSYATSLNNLGGLYEAMGEYGKAEPLWLQALDIRQRVVGEEHPDYATSLNNLAALYRLMDEYGKAEPLYLRAREIRKNAVGAEHPLYAQSLNNLAVLYRSMGEYGKAERLYRQAQVIERKALGEEHPSYATTLNNLAFLYRLMGEYRKAQPLYVQCVDIKKKRLGEEHPSYATSLGNLAALYESMGAYGEAERLYLRALDIEKKVLGEKHPGYAASLNSLAFLYWSMGEYGKAEPLYRQAQDIWKGVFGEEHSSHATSLNNLALLYDSMGEHSEAERLYLRALDIERNVLGEEHPRYATSLNNLAFLYGVRGEYAKAEPLHQQARDIREKVLGEAHPDYAQSITNLALLYHLMGEYAKAEPLYLQARDISASVLGEDHPGHAKSLGNLAGLYDSMGEYAKAEPIARRAYSISLAFARLTATAQSEAAAQQFLQANWSGPDLVLSVRRHVPAADPRETYAFAWQGRGLLTQITSERRRSLSGSVEARTVQDELGQVAQQLAQLTLAAVPPGQNEGRRTRLAELNQRKEELERELAQRSGEYRREVEIERTAPADLIRRLPETTALIDLRETTVWPPSGDGKRESPSRREYEAFILRRTADEPGWSVAWIHLGPAAPINQAASQWLALIEEQRDGQPDGPARRLREMLWQPLEPHLAGIEHVVLLPDSSLCFIPWAALPGREPGSVLLEEYAISTALSGPEFYRLLSDEPAEGDGGLLLVGGVRYDARPAAPPPRETRLANGRNVLRAAGQQGLWEYLEGSRRETKGIATTWLGESRPTLLEDEHASKAALRQALPGAKYIHLATHGFFADARFRSYLQHDDTSERLFGTGQELLSAGRRGSGVTGRNPLLLSGLVLAGANLPPATDDLGLPVGDDGILTAEEVVGLDLSAAELVVLSACDTGRGTEAGGGEGVFGLQRAFQLAGARNVVASLWMVDDEATAALMRLFYYKLWREEKPALQALREAQLAVYRYPERIAEWAGGPLAALERAPKFGTTVKLPEEIRRADRGQPAPTKHWAAFVLSGAGW